MFDFEHYFDTHPDKGWMYNQKPYFNVSVPLDPEEEWQVYSAGAIFYRGQKRHIYLLKDYEYVDFNGQLIIHVTVYRISTPRLWESTRIVFLPYRSYMN